MAGYVGGSVTARVILDISEFKSSVGIAKEQLGELKSAIIGLNKNSGLKGVKDTAKQLKDMSKNATQTETKIKELRNSFQEMNNINLDNLKSKLNNINKELANEEKYYASVGAASHKYWNQIRDNTVTLTDYKSNISRVNTELQKQIAESKRAATEARNLENAQKKANAQFGAYKQSLAQDKYYASVNAASHKYWNQIRQTTITLNDYKSNVARINTELQAQTNKTNQLSSAQQKLNAHLEAYKTKLAQDRYYASVGAASHKYWTQIRKGTITLNDYKANISKVNAELQAQAGRTSKVASAQQKLNAQLEAYRAKLAEEKYYARVGAASHKYWKQVRNGTITLNDYKSKMSEINNVASKQASAQIKSAKATQKTATSMKNLAGKTNYVNKNLWKLRGIILGIRTIFLSFGGIYIWQFFEEMISTTKQTLAVKSEMEQFLKMNDKLGKHGGGIDTFNKGLDQTIKKFKKLNKYTLGETVASIGKEFDLNAEEMKSSMDVIAMVQSEYVRAGRKESEAALAVKDILQGEFRRLSMETGVGEEELKALGWSGKKEDVMGMMDAIKKAGEARHWDDFARKATSLTDVFNILKNRMAEFGAELADAITPMIVGGFNTMADAFDYLKDKYNGLSAGMKVGIDFGAMTAGFLGLSTVILKLWKGFGLLDVASVGFKKSIMAAIFNLNLADVKTYGFTKTLMGVITKTNASTVAGQGFIKTLGSWVLGVDAAVASEKGFLTAIAKHGFELRNSGKQITAAEVATLKWHQKLAMAKTGVNKSTAANYSFVTSMRKTISVLGLLRKAVVVFTLVNLIKNFADLAMYMDKAQKNIEGFYKVVDDGKNIQKEVNKEYDVQKARVDDLKKQINEYNAKRKDTLHLEQQLAQAKANKHQAKLNKEDIKHANEMAKAAQKQLDVMASSISLQHQSSMAKIYNSAGMSAKEATVKASKYSQTVKEGYKQQTLAYHQYNKRLDAGVKHMQEHIGYMKQSGADSKQLTKYAEDYDMVLQETSKHWKKFWEGDIWSGASAVLGELKLAFIDLSYNEHFIALTKELDKTWKSWQPTLRTIGKILGNLLNTGMDFAASFLSTDVGKTTAMWGAFGVTVGAVAYKMRGLFSTGKNVINFFANLGSKLTEVIPKLKKYGDVSKNTPTTTPTSTPTPTTTVPGGVEKGKFWKTVGQDARNVARNIAKASMYIAGAMVLATEAIILIQAPMSALAGTGEHFKKLEPNIRKGIDGLKLIAPILGVLLPPVVALMVVMEKFGDTLSYGNIGKAIGTSAVGIAGALLLVAEAIIMMVAPLSAIAGLGAIRSQLDEGNLKQGMSSIQLVGESLKLLVPFIPVFALGVGLISAAILTEGIGTVITVAVVGGIALGMGILAESIISLAAPLRAIEGLGSMQVNMEAVNQGANVIKVTGEALKSVSVAMDSMGSIIWDDLQTKIGEFITGSSVIDEITKEEGLIDKIADFNSKFSEKMKNFSPIDDLSIVSNLTDSATVIKQVSDAITKITDVMNNLPLGVNVSEDSPITKFANSLAGEGEKVQGGFDSASINQYLTSVESIIDEVNKFNSSLKKKSDGFVAPPTDLVSKVQQSASFLNQLKGVVDKLQGTMQSTLGTQVASGVSTAVSFLQDPVGTVGGFFGGGGYKSRIGSALQNMEDVIDDLVTFNNRVNGKSIGDSPNVDGLLNFVKAVETAISKVESALSSSKPRLETNARGLGDSLTKGFNQGLQSIKNIKVVDLIVTPINQNKGKIFSLMSTMGTDARTNFTSKISGMSDATKSEMGQIGKEIDSGKSSNGAKAHGLGAYLVSQFKAGAGIASPGYMARAMVGEVGYIKDAIQTGINTLPIGVQTLATAMVNQFNPKFNTDFLNFTQNTDGLNLFNQGMQEIQETSENTLTSTNTTFSTMETTINTTFDNIANNTTKKYSQLQNTTKTSLHHMLSQTTRNIGAIKTSWKGMQTALIQSAENIRSQTSAKINTLQNNMASFWRKIQNPGLLVSGSSTIRSPRRPSRSVGVKRSVGSTLRGGGFAGSPSPSRRSAGSNDVIKTPFTKKSSAKGFAMKELIDEYLTLLMSGEIPYAGHWDFDWGDDIQKLFMNWHPQFPKYKSLTNLLSVADFDKSDFPVKGNAKFAKEYIKDAIEQTHYVYYYNSRHGNNPAAIWNAGGFNCWDGHILVMALASALGFPGGRTMHGMWGKDRHVWARIPGLGDIDSTAIQKGYGFTRGSRSAGMSPPPSHKEDFGTKNTYNIEVTVNVDGNADKRVMEEAGEIAGKKIIDMLKPSMATGR